MRIDKKDQYPGFDHPIAELSAYLLSMAMGMFSISLNNGDIIHYCPADVECFKEWLDAHKIKDIKADDWAAKNGKNEG